MENDINNQVETTDSWAWGKIIKHVILPKPKGSPKAGKKEIGLRIGFGAIFGLIALSIFSGGNLPSCKSSDSTNLVEKIINDLPLAKATGAKFVSLKEIEELGFNKKSEIRSCSAILVTTRGEDDLQYSIIWSNKDKGEYYITAEIF